MNAPRAALLVKVDSIGDVILFAPALHALRAGWPTTRLVVLVRQSCAELGPLLADAPALPSPPAEPAGQASPAAVGGVPEPSAAAAPVSPPAIEWLPTSLDPFNRSPTDDPAEVARLREFVAALQPEVIVAATARRTWLGILLAASCPAARRVALGEVAADEFFDTQLRVQLGVDSATAFTETVATPDDEPDWQRNHRLAEALLGRPVARAVPALTPPPAATAESILAQHRLAPGRYAVCAAAGFAHVRIKTWPAERFAAAIAHLRERHGLPTLLVGSEAERAHLEGVAGAAAIWTGRAGELSTLASLLAQSALFVGNDTGAMHLAAAYGVPVVAVFGGGTWPRFAPAARGGVALVHPLPCFGCGWDCAFGDAPCIDAITVPDFTAAIDDAIAGAAFTVRPLARLTPETHAFIAQAAHHHRARSAGHLARQHKLEALTEHARARDVALAAKEQEIAALKGVCDEREKTIFILDGHVRHFQTENNALRAERDVLAKTLAAQPADAAKAARAIADQLVHIRNLEALLRQRDTELAELRASQTNRAAGLHDLENAKHYGRLLEEKEAVIRALGEGLAQRDSLLQQLAAESTATGRLRLLWRATRLHLQERVFTPLDSWLFHVVVEKHWMQIGVLRHYEPRPLVWDRRLPAARLPAGALPHIAVVTPSYGQERFLERTLRSVLDQEYPKLLYVVQDGGSRDRSPEIIARHAARLRHWESAPDQGQADAVRRGFAHVAGELGSDDLMAWLNSDDLLAPGALRFVGEYFAAHPEVDAIYGHRIIINEDDRDVGRWIMPPHEPATLEWIDYVPQETLFWRKRLWDRAGGIDPSFQFALDWDLLARFQQAGGRLVRVPYFYGAFRVHAGQKTSQVIHTTGADEMRRVRARFHRERPDDFETIERHARRVRFRGALTARLHALGLRR